MDMRALFADAAAKMARDLSSARHATAHASSRGDAGEESVKRFLRRYLPASLDVHSGHVVDSSGNVSKQLDVIITSADRTPVFYDDDASRIVPVEGVVAVVEVKSSVSTGDLRDVVDNMTSVKSLSKTAFVRQTGHVITSSNVYGRDWETFPTLYFLFAFETRDLSSLGQRLNELQVGLELWNRVDCAIVLSEGVLLNHRQGREIQAAPFPGSSLAAYRTQNALLLFYVLTSHLLLQAEVRPIRVASYLGLMAL